MSKQNLSITNVVNVSIASAEAGTITPNVNNIALVTAEAPLTAWDDAYRAYVDAASVGVDFGTSSETYQCAAAMFAQQVNLRTGDGQLIIYPMGVSSVGESLLDALTALRDAESFGKACYAGFAPSNNDIIAAGTYAAGANFMLFAPTYQKSDLQEGGLAPLVLSASLKAVRVLYHPITAIAARVMASAYASRMTTDFYGSNTCLTPHLKGLAGITAASINQTDKNLAEAVGADIYCTIGGVPKVLASGANGFYDQVYNLLWLKAELQTVGFNALAQTTTKIPQTEAGMDSFKSKLVTVLEQGVRNGYIAPGAWNNTDTFGDPLTFHANINAVGYYMYSLPVVLQAANARAARQAPLVQIAVKEAGGIHSASILVNIDA